MNLKSKTNKLILGTVQFGLDYGINNKTGKIEKAEAFRIMDYAKQLEIHGLDTAAAYGNSEEIIGDYIRESGVENLKIITKFDLKKHASISESIRHSLQKLQIDSLETVFFHNYTDYENYRSQLDTIGSDQLLFSHIGVSIYTNEELEAVLEDPRIDFIQLPFNLLDNESLRKELLVKAKGLNKKIMTRSVFLQGLFFMNASDTPEQLNPLKSYLSKIKSLAAESNVSIETLALQYVLSKSYIDYVLIGVDSLEQLKKNVSNLGQQINPEVFEQIDAIHVPQPTLLNPSLWNL